MSLTSFTGAGQQYVTVGSSGAGGGGGSTGPWVRLWTENWGAVPGTLDYDERTEPESPAGRFCNLDWEEAS